MQLLGIQLASIGFSIFMIYFTYLCYRRNYFETTGLVTWLAIFSLLIIATIFPSSFSPFANLLKIARVFDLFIVMGIFFLVVITFINFIYIQKVKIKLDKLIQDEAIKESEKPNSKAKTK